MNILVILALSLVILGVISYLLGKGKRFTSTPNIDTPNEAPREETDECCGQHIVCEKDNLLSAMNKAIEYYDDEELDVFKRKDPSAYNDDEIELFRSVLYTLAVNEVEGWLISLQLREIDLPTVLRDEAFLMIQEQRLKK